ncbi:bifunctional indole-3-glycerol-phosphate synthase TrpC/phosphoribosylanthranilate isomerase TrpF [Vibrio salinus]|uniref:bifunctional indole-3-glycerol-phosphate synthase TrpC/phosphoribosylanthranilate isomerase TrpF n=1 Tax=Vibrio salinus TaxID=2899784 RepID=UPI001E59BB6F|nr:bifunctional indole-3-glycerol-phosphate synthase TrpC/phosphoribosylanthranilate isomerase TrpF [Vibrio salinus]MCE0492702.1 bifunctional indole-3-glycerol-phosphate synthase TrpC/phosphoribosylanthranilate isomerase TrpF [Vibrio salinus]
MTGKLSEHITTKDTEMAEVLAKIVADKRVWVEERMKVQPLDSFQSQVTTSDRSFYDALKSDSTAFILECKKASPSKGLIREHFDLDGIASVYRHYANAISVLTDEKYFQGNLDFVNQVRSQVTQPVLCKDFMISTYQVYLARYYQADAILLMLSVLDDRSYQELAGLAHSLGMGILTEASNEEEAERAIKLGAKVIGINNRNLRDLTTDLERTKHLAPMLPKDVTIISESGIYTNNQVRELSRYANGFLIGSSLMAEDDLEKAVRKVIYGEVKVCGLTSPEDAAKAHHAGAIYGGLILVGKSPRYVTDEEAKHIIAGASLRYVGVFQNHAIDEVSHLAKMLKLHAVQLHGNEDQKYVDKLRATLPDSIQIWKAYGVTDRIPQLIANNVDRHLCDSKVGHCSGGTGQAFNWQLLSGNNQVMLAGGLTPDNIQQAANLGCIGLDLNSGVESEPGKKDSQKLKLAFDKLRQY